LAERREAAIFLFPAVGYRMNVTQLAILDAEQVAVGPFVLAEFQEYIDRAQRLIDDILPFDQVDILGDTDIAAVLRRAACRIDPAFETGAGRAPRNLDALVLEQVEIGVGRSDQLFA